MSNEPRIEINGTVLTIGQAMTVRVAVSCFFADKEEMRELGPIGPLYEQRLAEVLTLMRVLRAAREGKP